MKLVESSRVARAKSSKINSSLYFVALEGIRIETLESRVLMSASVTNPDYVLAYNGDGIDPASSSSIVGLTAATVRKAYGLDSIYFNGVKGDGTGQTIAIVDAYTAPNIVSDLHAFDLAMGLNDPTRQIITQAGATADSPGGWGLESNLDVEWAHAVAPGAKILLVQAKSASYTDLMWAVDAARNTAGVSVVSMSWGSTEFSSYATYDSHFVTPAGHTPITFFASSGDYGAYNSGGSTKYVSYPAVSQYVVGVGGTRLTTDGSGNYVSESGWGNGTLSGSQGGAGGGISQYVAKPTYQSSVTQSSTFRTVPDVGWLADPNSGVAVYDSYDVGASTPWVQVGGTSLAAPMWAGLMAIVNQGRVQNGLATLNGKTETLPMLYALPSSNFHDITTGNNGFAAGVGYDLVTGLGTPIASLLAPAMAGFSITPPTPTPTIGSFAVNPSSATVGTASVTLTASNVTESGGSISSVAFYRESNGITGLQVGSDTLVPGAVQNGTTWSTSAATSALAAGTYTYYVQATDPSANTATASAALTLNPVVVTPANDNFASATVLSGSSLTVTGSTVNATKQSGEPSHAGNTGGHSIWYYWTAPASGTATINTSGSNFDTLLGVYTGTSVSALTKKSSNDDATRSVVYSKVSFKVTAGTTYRIAVDGYNGASGNVTLNLSAPVAGAVKNVFAMSAAAIEPATVAVSAPLEVAAKSVAAFSDVQVAEVDSTEAAPAKQQADVQPGISISTGLSNHVREWLSQLPSRKSSNVLVDDACASVDWSVL